MLSTGDVSEPLGSPSYKRLRSLPQDPYLSGGFSDYNPDTFREDLVIIVCIVFGLALSLFLIGSGVNQMFVGFVLGFCVGAALSAFVIKFNKDHVEVKTYDAEKVYKINHYDGLWTVLNQNDQGVGFQMKNEFGIKNIYMTHSQIKQQGIWETAVRAEQLDGEGDENMVDEGTFQRVS